MLTSAKFVFNLQVLIVVIHHGSKNGAITKNGAGGMFTLNVLGHHNNRREFGLIWVWLVSYRDPARVTTIVLHVFI